MRKSTALRITLAVPFVLLGCGGNGRTEHVDALGPEAASNHAVVERAHPVGLEGPASLKRRRSFGSRRPLAGVKVAAGGERKESRLAAPLCCQGAWTRSPLVSMASLAAAGQRSRLTVTVPLENIDRHALMDALRTLHPSVHLGSSMAGAEQLVLAGKAEILVEVVDWIQYADRRMAHGTEMPVLQRIELQVVRAEECADFITELLGLRRANVGSARRCRSGRGWLSSTFDPRLLGDPAGRCLLVMAMPEDLGPISDLVAKLDQRAEFR